MSNDHADMNSATPEAPDLNQTYRFEFTGDWQELLPIALKNFLFTVLTLGFYRFWARTNVRRYLWSHIRFLDDPMEYTGTGGELFKGFLIALVIIFMPLFLLIFVGQFLMLSGGILSLIGGLLFLAGYVAFLFLPGLAYYRALKYRLSKTRWRGIRASQEQQGFMYAFLMLVYTLLAAITFGLAIPFMENKLWEYESNNRRFGSGQFRYYGGTWPIFLSFIAALIVYVFLVILCFIVLSASIADFSTAVGNPSDDFIFNALLAYLGIIGAGVIAFSYYNFKKTLQFWGHSRFQNLDILFIGTFDDMIKLYIGNFFIITLSLGILMPIAQMRMVRYYIGNTVMTGHLDLSTIEQSTSEQYSTGEGLAEGFDMGVI